MAYIDYNELLTRYPDLLTWGSSADVSSYGANQTQVDNQLIAYSDAEVNARLAVAYSVPFSANHLTVKDLSMDLAYVNAYKNTDPDKVEVIMSNVNSRFQRLIDGDEYIMTGSGTIAPTGSAEGIWDSNMDYAPTMSMLNAENSLSHVSSERLQAETDERT